MLTFSGAILLMSVRTRNTASDANLLKKGMEFLMFTTPVRLHSKDLSIKEPFN
jgi:hypothetical protein